MPLYEYDCPTCGKRFERIRKFSDPPLEVCPLCGGGPIVKRVSSPAIQFKGSGFYLTDYGRTGSDSATGGDSKSSGESKSDKSSGTAASSASDSKSGGETKSSETKPAGESKSAKADSGSSAPSNSKKTGD